MANKNLYELPSDLPVPQDDGACDHLTGMQIPDLNLFSTEGRLVKLNVEFAKPTVLFFYPRTGEPGKATGGDWELIPGARGCTPQSCAYRDFIGEFKALSVQVFACSSQSTEYQQEFVQRNHIPYEILSDADFHFTDTLSLPTFEYHGQKLLKRLALFIVDSKIVKAFYPVFPPDKNAETVLNWIKSHHKSF